MKKILILSLLVSVTFIYGCGKAGSIENNSNQNKINSSQQVGSKINETNAVSDNSNQNKVNSSQQVDPKTNKTNSIGDNSNQSKVNSSQQVDPKTNKTNSIGDNSNQSKVNSSQQVDPKTNKTNSVGDNSNQSKVNSSQQVDPKINKTNSVSDNSSNEGTKTVDNTFFFNKNISQLNYKGNFLFNDINKKDVKLHINKVDDLKYGKLYELKLDSIENVPNERLELGYFYVQKDKIYKISATQENLNKLRTSEDMPSDSVIVCQDNGKKDTLKEEEKGIHQYIVVNGDTREYHSYNNQIGTGYYEAFTWEKNKGLINYRSGYGAERDSIELQINNN